ncbi:DNA repair protein RadA [Thermodesulfatator autotrophicus]|uniref:DNA repair protein RadA n=1 Tax=Thermodesulfatator autotrophicus TaxID=1795632 RepID=A0A177E5J0_9BACT|nr:DNA repair protein RadA [Thermodesulfatator autotrophicus]OAG27204.1 DNA repair protein RadA [Thermodesulfatator autotrophicus]
MAGFYCQECGYKSLKWLGRCPGCGSWGTLIEESPSKGHKKVSRQARLLKVSEVEGLKEKRLPTGLSELDQVLGGGIVPGSLILLGGDPGIGKSTLLLQVLKNLAEDGHKVIYLSGEESPQQIKLRAERLNISQENILLLPETDLAVALSSVEEVSPILLAVDSIQTVFWPEVSSAPGSVSQVRECTNKLLEFAKAKNIAVILVGHVTKEGMLAGPRVLEHLVDTVLYFEGERTAHFRILRAVKNRFGSTNEIGVFEMTSSGLKPISNPSAVFLTRETLDAPGSVICATLEGTRPILVEVQALVSRSYLATPRRTSVGFDPQRLAMIAAILEKKAGLSFYDQDIYLNVVGGLKLTEPGVDLAVAIALASSRLDRPLPQGLFLFGEIGLTGEVRQVSYPEARLKEGEKLGFSKVCAPRENLKNTSVQVKLEQLSVSNLQEAIETLLL